MKNSASVSRSDVMKKGPRSIEEDALLMRLVEQHGSQRWSLISAAISGRSGKSCRLRWCNQLNPDVHHRPFTWEEDILIAAAQACHGNKWPPSHVSYWPHRQLHQEPLETPTYVGACGGQQLRLWPQPLDLLPLGTIHQFSQ